MTHLRWRAIARYHGAKSRWIRRTAKTKRSWSGRADGVYLKQQTARLPGNPWILFLWVYAPQLRRNLMLEIRL